MKIIRVSKVGFGNSKNETKWLSFTNATKTITKTFLISYFTKQLQTTLGLRPIHIMPIINIVYYSLSVKKKCHVSCDLSSHE